MFADFMQRIQVWRHKFKGWWCRNMHSETCKRFTLPKPHPRGQQFKVSCALCCYQYIVVTPLNWSSPWNPNGRISSNKREHPVHEHDGKWWYWDADHMFREGPFEDRAKAYAAFYNYYTQVLKEGSALTSADQPDNTESYWSARGLANSARSANG